jgi:hypothetical protein
VDGLLRVQKTLLNRWAARGVKLGAARMDLCSQEVRWCGRVVSKDGVWLDPSSVSAPAARRPPVTRADLQQFVCAQLSPATPKKYARWGSYSTKFTNAPAAERGSGPPRWDFVSSETRRMAESKLDPSRCWQVR